MTKTEINRFANKVCNDEKSYNEVVRVCTEYEKRIDTMKCGQNCKHSYLYQEDRKCKFTYCDCINCKDKWELCE